MKFAISFVFAMVLVDSVTASDLTLKALKTTYAVDLRKCEKVLGILDGQQICRPFGGCNNPEEWQVVVNGKPTRMFKPLAMREYGYNEVQLTTTSLPADFDIIYVDKFMGDRNPRVLESYKVSRAELQSALSLPPGPVTYEQWVKLNPPHSIDTNAAAFSALLSHGEKVSSEWSPVVEVDGEYFLFERECVGQWNYGYYGCTKITKLTAKKLASSAPTVPYCVMTRSATFSEVHNKPLQQIARRDRAPAEWQRSASEWETREKQCHN